MKFFEALDFFLFLEPSVPEYHLGLTSCFTDAGTSTVGWRPRWPCSRCSPATRPRRTTWTWCCSAGSTSATCSSPWATHLRSVSPEDIAWIYVWKILKFLKSFWILQQSVIIQRFWICASCTLVSLGHSFSAEFLSQHGDSLPCFLSPAKSLEAVQLRCNARKKRGEIKDTQLFKLEPVSAMRLHLHRINNWQKSLQDVLWHLSSFTEHQEQNFFRVSE